MTVSINYDMDQDSQKHFMEVALKHYFVVNGKDAYDELIKLFENDEQKAIEILDVFVDKYKESILLNIISDKDTQR